MYRCGMQMLGLKEVLAWQELDLIMACGLMRTHLILLRTIAGISSYTLLELNKNLVNVHKIKWQITTYIIRDGSKDDIFLVDRSMQALETVDYICTTSSCSPSPDDDIRIFTPDLIILAGDLNTEPASFPYRILTQFGSLIDSNGKYYIFLLYFSTPRIPQAITIPLFHSCKYKSCYFSSPNF